MLYEDSCCMEVGCWHAGVLCCWPAYWPRVTCTVPSVPNLVPIQALYAPDDLSSKSYQTGMSVKRAATSDGLRPGLSSISLPSVTRRSVTKDMEMTGEDFEADQVCSKCRSCPPYCTFHWNRCISIKVCARRNGHKPCCLAVLQTTFRQLRDPIGVFEARLSVSSFLVFPLHPAGHDLRLQQNGLGGRAAAGPELAQQLPLLPPQRCRTAPDLWTDGEMRRAG